MSYMAGGTWHFAFKAFLDSNVPSFGQLVYLHAQVARGGTRLLLEVVEVGLVNAG
jgi:hypothetical protein